MRIDNINKVFFIGVGGIGMSALARYFNHRKVIVAGYDLTRTDLTDKLMAEGIDIIFNDDTKSLNPHFTEGPGDNILIVYTPAIPPNNKIYQYFKSGGFRMTKRSELLGNLVSGGKGIAIAGTHGKTSVSALTAHLLNQTPEGCNAFLGGVSKNYGTNLLISETSKLIVVEADEYDRSFLHLYPDLAVITSMDADHLDIYGNVEKMKEAFSEFASQVSEGGTLICKKGLNISIDRSKGVKILNYGLEKGADYFAGNISVGPDGLPVFDFESREVFYRRLNLGVPGRFNLENAVAAIAVALNYGATEKEIRNGLATFRGVSRRFDIKINTPECVLIDDYAHHPAELLACISSLREWFPKRRLTGIFQPHLYSRTRDFASEFAQSLEGLDDLILLDIYPAREEAVPGVTSELIFSRINMESKILCNKEQLPGIIAGMPVDVVVTMGAGDIDKMVEPLRVLLLNKINCRE